MPITRKHGKTTYIAVDMAVLKPHILWFIWLCFVFIAVNCGDVVVRRDVSGDVIYNVSRDSCRYFVGNHGNQTCYCPYKETFYSTSQLSNDYRCFSGTGNNIGNFFSYLFLLKWLTLNSFQNIYYNVVKQADNH